MSNLNLGAIRKDQIKTFDAMTGPVQKDMRLHDFYEATTALKSRVQSFEFKANDSATNVAKNVAIVVERVIGYLATAIVAMIETPITFWAVPLRNAALNWDTQNIAKVAAKTFYNELYANPIDGRQESKDRAFVAKELFRHAEDVVAKNFTADTNVNTFVSEAVDSLVRNPEVQKYLVIDGVEEDVEAVVAKFRHEYATQLFAAVSDQVATNLVKGKAPQNIEMRVKASQIAEAFGMNEVSVALFLEKRVAERVESIKPLNQETVRNEHVSRAEAELREVTAKLAKQGAILAQAEETLAKAEAKFTTALQGLERAGTISADEAMQIADRVVTTALVGDIRATLGEAAAAQVNVLDAATKVAEAKTALENCGAETAIADLRGDLVRAQRARDNATRVADAEVAAHNARLDALVNSPAKALNNRAILNGARAELVMKTRVVAPAMRETTRPEAVIFAHNLETSKDAGAKRAFDHLLSLEGNTDLVARLRTRMENRANAQEAEVAADFWDLDFPEAPTLFERATEAAAEMRRGAWNRVRSLLGAVNALRRAPAAAPARRVHFADDGSRVTDF